MSASLRAFCKLLPALTLTGFALLPAWPPQMSLPLRANELEKTLELEPVQPDRSGEHVLINANEFEIGWHLFAGDGQNERRVFIPVEVLTSQLGAEIEASNDGSVFIWYDHRVPVPKADLVRLDGDVAINVAPLAKRFGWWLVPLGSRLHMKVPKQRLFNVRIHQKAAQVRIVLDLLGPAAFRQRDGQLEVELVSRPVHLQRMEELGIPYDVEKGVLRFPLGVTSQLTSLSKPERIVIDLPRQDFLAASGRSSATFNSLKQRFQLETRDLRVGNQTFHVTSARLDLNDPTIGLLPLTDADGMKGLKPLNHLAKGWQAQLAINGGFFNRIHQLPLGALRRDGAWLSGPILGRGAIGRGWEQERPVFGRLALQETVKSASAELRLNHLNSGYVQKGVARYDRSWGSRYQAITGEEVAVRVEQDRVVQVFSADELKRGVTLLPEGWLLVARAGVELPLRKGDTVSLHRRITPASFTGQPHVLGAGPLLLLSGRQVLDAAQEGFQPGFAKQRAPRSVIAWGQDHLWFLTVEGITSKGPTLVETAELCRRLGIEDALNLDGGSSTSLVMAGIVAVRGRGLEARIHNGLGVVATDRLIPPPEIPPTVQ